MSRATHALEGSLMAIWGFYCGETGPGEAVKEVVILVREHQVASTQMGK